MTTAKMKEALEVQLESPRFENGKPLLVAGLLEHYTSATMKKIPDLWRRLEPYFGNVPGQVGRVAYGLSFNTLSSDGLDYVAGVEVSSFASLPEEFSHISIPAQKYAVFSHREHVSKVSQTCDAIGRKWLPSSGHEPSRAAAGAPDFFELYGEKFDPQTGMGDIEVWIPIKA